MARGRPWSELEDAAIRVAAADNLQGGILAFKPHTRLPMAGDYAQRLRAVADQFGRSYAAVRKRAQSGPVIGEPTTSAAGGGYGAGMA